MKKVVVGRRQVLRGSGAFTLGLPFLPSLVAAPAFAQVTGPRRPKLVSIASDHGAVWVSKMFPADAKADKTMTLFPGHDMHYGALAKTTSGTNAVLSEVLTAPANVLTDRIVGKMNVVEGLAVPFYLGHHTGGHLGNYARNDGNGEPGVYVQQFPLPTIDQVLAYSPKFYGDLTGVKKRVLVAGSRNGYSWAYSDPVNQTGKIQEITATFDPANLFDDAIGMVMNTTPDPAPKPAARKPIADRILANYKSLRESNRRLSAKDKQRLDDHVARIAELQRRVNVDTGSGPLVSKSCGSVTRPKSSLNNITDSYNDPAKSKERFALFNDVIVAAFICGTSRIATLSASDPFAMFSGSWHQDTAHQWSTSGAQERIVAGHRNIFQWVFLDLATKLDAIEEADGKSYLDSTLITWSQESGMSTHDPVNIPLIMAGSAGGFVKTGQFLDYRNRVKSSAFPYVSMPDPLYYGLPWHQWLGTALQAMGLSRSDYEKGGKVGYGLDYATPDFKPKFVSGVFENAGKVLPLFGA